MAENNFWTDVEKGMLEYLTKYLDAFKTNYNSNNVAKDPRVDAFLGEIAKKEGFEELFNYTKSEIKNLFDELRKDYFNDKNPEQVEQKKINTLIEVSKFFNAVIPLPRFLNDFMESAKKSSPVDLNQLFVTMMKLEVAELVKMYDGSIKGLDPSVDKCLEDINKSTDALEIWNLINQLGLFLQRNISLANFSEEKETEKLNAQLANLDKIEQDYKAGKVKLPEFNKEKITGEMKAYHDFVLKLTVEKRNEIVEKTTEYRNRVLPLVQIIQCLHDLLMSILTATNIINSDKQ
ncbi:hypothetical protein [Spiroplasma chrysopicola]|uniref:Uncharacterized protein n=1 Tax=Spiroplasma chrysopicola DF-1 TaxID=1276227 RepID=R4UF56_9MOLU|nr:hypothetical protein [Spiroplasma chrysopicola]AGM24755.1 hypothetical protein SCHRY_v1c01700 [Spiroplasma chrysopicola DF-1]